MQCVGLLLEAMVNRFPPAFRSPADAFGSLFHPYNKLSSIFAGSSQNFDLKESTKKQAPTGTMLGSGASVADRNAKCSGKEQSCG
jgi:hypothetical protein